MLTEVIARFGDAEHWRALTLGFLQQVDFARLSEEATFEELLVVKKAIGRMKDVFLAHEELVGGL